MADDTQDWFSAFLDSPWTKAGSAGLGVGSDIFSFIQNIQRANEQKKLFDMLSSPGGLLKGYPGFTDAALQQMKRQWGADWASATGGAPGGATTQFFADALAKANTENMLKYMQTRAGALQGAQGAIGGTSPIGGLGAILKQLQILSQIRNQGGGQGGLVSGFPGGVGGDYAGSSDYLRSAPAPDLAIEV